MKTIGTLLGVISLVSLPFIVSSFAQSKDKTVQETTRSQSRTQSSSKPTQQQESMMQGLLLSTDTIIGNTVKNPQGEDVGDLERLMINPRTGVVKYAVLSIGGFLGLGEKMIVVPWQALKVARDGNTFLLNASKQLLQEAPDYKQDQEAGLATSEREAEVYAYYDTKPDWVRSAGGWGSGSPLARLYKDGEETTIEGQVVSVDSRAPLPGMSAGLQLMVKPQEGDDPLRVQLGPEWYLERQNLDIRQDDEIVITGAQVVVDKEPLLVARQVELHGETLQLRDEDGMPRWSSRGKTP